MAARVTPDELILMYQLYNQYHSYARVAREMNRSASCVRHNILMKHAPKVVIASGLLFYYYF